MLYYPGLDLPIEMNKEWKEIWTEKVTSNMQVNLPDDLEENITYEDPLHGHSVRWSFDTVAEVMIVSDRELSSDRYEVMASSQLTGSGQIKPPSKLVDRLPQVLYPDLRMVYLAHGEMLPEVPNDEPRSVYLLTDNQAQRFLNEAPGEQDEDSLRDQLRNTPAFLPPVR